MVTKKLVKKWWKKFVKKLSEISRKNCFVRLFEKITNVLNVKDSQDLDAMISGNAVIVKKFFVESGENAENAVLFSAGIVTVIIVTIRLFKCLCFNFCLFYVKTQSMDAKKS